LQRILEEIRYTTNVKYTYIDMMKGYRTYSYIVISSHGKYRRRWPPEAKLGLLVEDAAALVCIGYCYYNGAIYTGMGLLSSFEVI